MLVYFSAAGRADVPLFWYLQVHGTRREHGMNPWVILAVSIVAEVIGTTLLAKSQGFTRPAFGIAALVIFCGCFWAIAHVLTRIPVGVAYAVWAGMGIVLVSLSGWLVLHQTLNPTQLFFIGLIVAGTVGLNFSTSA